ncbi:hypothetical protein ACHAXS_012087 [Conticribra weissflogii]
MAGASGGDVGFGAVMESTSGIIADRSSIDGVITGAEEVLFGDAATDTVVGATSDALAGVGDVIAATADAGVGVLAMLPGWLVSGGLAALASELAFAVFAFFLLLQAGEAASKGVEINEDTLFNPINNSNYDNNDNNKDIDVYNGNGNESYGFAEETPLGEDVERVK